MRFHSLHLPRATVWFSTPVSGCHEPGTGASCEARTSPITRPASNEKKATRTVTEMARKIRIVITQYWFGRVVEFADADSDSTLAINS